MSGHERRTARIEARGTPQIGWHRDRLLDTHLSKVTVRRIHLEASARFTESRPSLSMCGDDRLNHFIQAFRIDVRTQCPSIRDPNESRGIFFPHFCSFARNPYNLGGYIYEFTI